MKVLKFSSIAFTVLLMFGIYACQKDLKSPDVTSNKGKPSISNKISTPIISCFAAYTTDVSIGILVTAGETGLPAGFSLQWMTAADYAANGNQWYASDDTRLCKASFSGNANDSRYSLLPGKSVAIKIGDILLDNGASTNCAGELVCGTAYVFRAFGHATNTLQRSDFTENLTCSTRACNDDGGCTLTQGYWKTHGTGQCAIAEGSGAWPVESLTLGNREYTADELCSILHTPVGGNGLIALAHQLIAAKLNVANGANSIDAIAQADALIGSLVVGTDYLAPNTTSDLTNILATYNEGGAEGENHCD